MPKITFLPSETTVDIPPGTDLLAAARKAGLEIDSPCGGEGTCQKCVVRVIDGELDGKAPSVLPAAAGADEYLLACQTRVGQAAATIELPTGAETLEGQFAETDQIRPAGKLLPKQWQFDPLATKRAIRVPQPQAEDGLSDLDRLLRAIRQELGRQEISCPLQIVRGLADTLRAEDGRVTVTLVDDDGMLHLVRIEPGDQTDRHYAAAVDIGTTTVAVRIIDLARQRVLATRSDYNDQMGCGLDVISRINYARRPERLAELRTRVLGTINSLLARAAGDCDVDLNDVSSAVLAGNTTMTHLLLGLSPEYIRLEPYTPTVLAAPSAAAGQVGIEINDDSWVCFSPAVGSYVGGDITAGLLCTELAGDSDRISLFIDIGTNGELVVGNKDFLLCCACSAGPAFEGGGIDCGMPAADGAIEKVDIDPETGQSRYWTIGPGPPRGICGSGMMDLLANLFLAGWIDPAGKLNRDRQCPYIEIDGRRGCYTLVSAEQSATGKPITVSETDIDNIMRAKAAIYAAARLMLGQVDIGFENLAHIYIAGGFGRHINLDKAIVLGLLPDVPREKFRFIGNASLAGAAMVATSRPCRRRQQALAARMTYFDLSTMPSYMNQYTGALFLPHTDPTLFPSVAEAVSRMRN